MESNIVIKVKFEETLRRFNAAMYGKEMEYDMEALRKKVIGLFNLSSDADLTLTYIDVDGDVVTLVDDDDLLDAIGQRLNPLRVNVLLNKSKGFGSRSFTRSSGSTTPMKSPRVPQHLQNVTASVTEVLNSLSEPLREAVSKMTLDAASQASSSAPQLAELVDIFSKIGQSYLFPGAPSQANPEQNGASRSNGNPTTNVTNDGPNLDVVPNPSSAGISSESSQKAIDTNIVEPPVTSAPGSVDLNQIPVDNMPFVNHMPAECYIPNVDSMKERGEASDLISADSTRHIFPIPVCPYSEMPMGDNSGFGHVSYPKIRPFKNFHTFNEGVGIFHRGVQCDGCGVHPIAGPRFKSKVKENYDLCSICFSDLGNDVDYIKMDCPSSYRHPRSKGLSDPVQRPIFFPPASYPFKGVSKPGLKLDSRFILDVNVMDGTLLAPLTPFSKIWRLRNTGSLVWPRGTQLVWIGGDRFSDTDSVEIEVPTNGVSLDEEINVAVDFTAPEQPGRYISYWRLSSPSGQRFGQRFWVLIQVEASLNDALYDRFQGLNLNLPPPVMNGRNVVKPVASGPFPLYDPPCPDVCPEPAVLVNGEKITKDQEENFPINDNLLVGDSSEPVSNSPDVSSGGISYPIIDMSEDVPPVAAPVSSAPPVIENNNVIEQTLLMELEDMGFKQLERNKYVLRKNEYNLELSVEDLCDDAEWDPILEELKEMGFYDRAKNKQLLLKNNGSIKRVVMDLIADEE